MNKKKTRPSIVGGLLLFRLSRVIFITLVITSCKVENKKEVIFNTLDINNNELINPTDIFIFDSLLILNDSYKNKFISIFNLKNNELLGRFVNMKDVKDLSNMKKIGNGYFAFSDLVENKHYWFKVDRKKKCIIDSIHEYGHHKSQKKLFSPIFIGDSILISLGLFDKGKYFFKYKSNIFFQDNYPVDSSKTSSIYHTNSIKYQVYQGLIKLKQDHSRIVYISPLGQIDIKRITSRGLIDIYKKEPERFPKYKLFKNGLSVALSKRNKFYFSQFKVSDSLIFILNSEGKDLTRSTNSILYNKRIDIYNWDGIFLKKLYLNRGILNFDINGKTLFAISKNRKTFVPEIVVKQYNLN